MTILTHSQHIIIRVIQWQIHENIILYLSAQYSLKAHMLNKTLKILNDNTEESIFNLSVDCTFHIKRIVQFEKKKTGSNVQS